MPNVVLFDGLNASGDPSLWETNGTVTFELAPVAPANLTDFNNEVLFEGFSSGQSGLWVTDGSAGGTFEVGGTNGLSPSFLTVFGNEVLFNGTSGGVSGLWATNGTAAGTHLLTNIARNSQLSAARCCSTAPVRGCPGCG
jgi:ELWxxDGT repeat protein